MLLLLPRPAGTVAPFLVAAVAVFLVGCASTVAPQGTTAGDVALTVVSATERSEPGCPIHVRVHMVAQGLEIIRGEMTWRVVHGTRVRSGTVPLSLVPTPTGSVERKAEVSFEPPISGSYRIEARIVDEAGRTSVATLRHDVTHLWPFEKKRACGEQPRAGRR
jgi:hypothetical protein